MYKWIKFKTLQTFLRWLKNYGSCNWDIYDKQNSLL